MARHPASESGRLSAAELYENARAEQALVLAIGGPTAPWEERAAWQALFDHGQLAKGQTAVIHGAACAFGSTAVNWPAGPAPR